MLWGDDLTLNGQISIVMSAAYGHKHKDFKEAVEGLEHFIDEETHLKCPACSGTFIYSEVPRWEDDRYVEVGRLLCLKCRRYWFI